MSTLEEKKPPLAKNRDITQARDVFSEQIKSLSAMSDRLSNEFSQAVDCLNQVKGRVIVTGVGKSGHVGRKIAATLASTGTRSQFVHPTEASHGDMGMIGEDDAVLALSKSGETRELTDLIHYCSSRQVPIIAITMNANSALAHAGTVSLVLPTMNEGCPMGLAPMSSTTTMMVLGDALSAVLMERRGFSSHDFKIFHPGGSLGQSLQTVEKLMHSGDELPIVDQDCDMRTALIAMTSKRFGCLGVLDHGGSLVGVVTDGDLRRHMSDNLLNLTVKSVMTTSPKTLKHSLLATEALSFMNQNKITSIFVCNEHESLKPIGIIHIHDCLRVMMG